MTAPVMVVGKPYNWIGQQERLVYLGFNFSGNGRWHQFAKVDDPERNVWCEVTSDQLDQFEETPAANKPVSLGDVLPAEISRVQDLLPLYASAGPAAGFAIAMMRRSLTTATQALASGDVVAMIRAYEDLKGYAE
jgi:hypothetical protein